VSLFAYNLGIAAEPDGSIRIGSAESLANIASHPIVRDRVPLLSEACEQAESAEIPATATLGGNLAQRPQCLFYRRGILCHKTGGETCPARDGDDDGEYLAILEGGPCWAVHPSDPAVALVALDASVEIDGLTGRRVVSARDFFVLPSERMECETVLQKGELIVSVRIPAPASFGVQRYRKVKQKHSSGFALVSLASARRIDGEVRLVLGGVSPRPYRVYTSIEEEATSGGLDEEGIAGLAERALLDAEPLAANGYKLELAATLLRDAIREIAAD
jgi:xanthine dehydrogenase YagS FAD-binding subunit